MKNFIVRKADKNDIDIIFELINGLAKYEKRPWDMTGTKEDLIYWLFDKNIATTFLAEENGKTIGYAIYYPIFGSFSAKGKAHLEDMFLLPEYRGKGLGKTFLKEIVSNVLSDGYYAMEWSALDWNESAIGFYKKIGAEQESGRVYFDFSNENMQKFINNNK